MSEIKARISADVKTAMKNKDTKTRDALRLLMSAFKQIEVDKRVELSDSDVIAIVQKQIKQRNDSIEQFEKADRDDLIVKEREEIEIFTPYLPKQLTDDELNSALKTIIEKTGASSIKELGKVMGMASKELQGVADGKRISLTAKAMLS